MNKGDYVFNRQGNTIRKVVIVYPDGTFEGECLRAGELKYISRPENWKAVQDNLVMSFTASRSGLTEYQKQAFIRLLLTFQPKTFVHGDCVGGDADGHSLVLDITLNIKPSINIEIHKYPSNLEKQRAFTEGGLVVSDPLPSLDRNKLIVDAGHCLVACPNSYEGDLRSGIWSVIDYAKDKFKVALVIRPNGSVWSGNRCLEF